MGGEWRKEDWSKRTARHMRPETAEELVKTDGGAGCRIRGRHRSGKSRQITPPPPASSPNGFLLCLNVSSDQKRRDIPAVSNPAGLIIATDERPILPGVE